MEQYTSYRESKINWVGVIPTHWRIGRPKYNYYLKGRIGWQGLKADEFIDYGPYYLVTGTDFKKGRVDWESCYHITKNRFDEAPEIHIQSGDLLVTKDGTIGKVAYIDDKPQFVSLNSHLLLMRPINKDFENRFLFWVIQSSVFENYYGETQSGSIMASLSQEKISNFSFPLPPINEQNIISAYLDKKISHIDAVIAEAKASIEEYKQWKASIIYEAVTKGLDPNVEMKDSGVEWIGKIPCKWQLGKIKNGYNTVLGKMLCSDKRSVDDTYENYMCAANIKWFGVNTVINKKMWFSPDEKKQYLLEKGNVLVMEGGMAGTACIYNDEFAPCYIQNSVHKCNAKNQNLNDFLYYWLFASYNAGYIDSICNRATIQHYTGEKLANTPMVFPPFFEQKEIVTYLNSKSTSIDSLVFEKESLISDLEAYKKSLIFEVVTGKRKVV